MSSLSHMSNAIRDGEEIEIEAGGQRWINSWHSSAAAPAGKPHGSAGICVTETGEVVLISADGETWDFPAGRPEGNETWEQTLRREMLEEAWRMSPKPVCWASVAGDACGAMRQGSCWFDPSGTPRSSCWSGILSLRSGIDAWQPHRRRWYS